jgi:hypothetical protein
LFNVVVKVAIVIGDEANEAILKEFIGTLEVFRNPSVAMLMKNKY